MIIPPEEGPAFVFIPPVEGPAFVFMTLVEGSSSVIVIIFPVAPVEGLCFSSTHFRHIGKKYFKEPFSILILWAAFWAQSFVTEKTTCTNVLCFRFIKSRTKPIKIRKEPVEF